MMQETKRINKIILKNKGVNKSKLDISLDKDKIMEYYKEMFNSKKWIFFFKDGQRAWYNRECEVAIPVKHDYNGNYSGYFGKKHYVIAKRYINQLFDDDCPLVIINAIKSSHAYHDKHYIEYDGGSFCLETKEIAGWGYNNIIKLSAVKIQREDFLNNFLCFTNDKLLSEAANIIGDGNKELTNSDVDRLSQIFSIDKNNMNLHYNITLDDEKIINDLIYADTKRAGLDKYDKKWLEDVNQGLWELWTDEDLSENNSENIIELKKPLIARNPACDIHKNGIIGIDFGTKSTIVSKIDGKNKISLIRIGVGQLNKSVETHHYENPTVMEFLDLEKFLADYFSADGRPETCIDDLRVSHPAENDLKSCEKSDLFYSFFYNIKQWCCDTERTEKIIDQQGRERLFPPLVSLDHDEFNPLEVYAYYLGLYINNMFNGIFLDYVLSFPVTFEKTVKEKITESFEAGLRKSLPETIVHNEEIMSKFRVRQGVSEPAAYAITALKNYKFEPEEDEKVLYGIYDFGGGTTDFDFGIWRAADDSLREEESYDYVIEHFGSEGDKYLGGENLLELLAFEVFKANAKKLQEGKYEENSAESVGFSFSLPKECSEFPGSETLISNTQEARRNIKQLVEVLRPFWEGIISEADDVENDNNAKKMYNGYCFDNSDNKFPIDDDGNISVDLFDKDGNLQSGFKLSVKKESENIDVDLIKILSDRIERGVSSFFNAVNKAFDNTETDDEIQIFLAGNSSKSPIVKKIFEQYINKTNGDEKKHNNFVLFPPLGTEEAFIIQRKRGIEPDTGISAPTGKTGVAYGLIEGREGGKIRVISEVKAESEAKFRYNIGIEKRGKFIMKLDRNEVEYGKWKRLVNAGKELEFYYTSLPDADKRPVDNPSVYLIHEQSEIAISSDIYIRAVSPSEIEYILSPQDSIPEDDANGILIKLGE